MRDRGIRRGPAGGRRRARGSATAGVPRLRLARAWPWWTRDGLEVRRKAGQAGQPGEAAGGRAAAGRAPWAWATPAGPPTAARPTATRTRTWTPTSGSPSSTTASSRTSPRCAPSWRTTVCDARLRHRHRGRVAPARRRSTTGDLAEAMRRGVSAARRRVHAGGGACRPAGRRRRRATQLPAGGGARRRRELPRQRCLGLHRPHPARRSSSARTRSSSCTATASR